MNPHYEISNGRLRLRPVAKEDIEQLRQWRNDKGLTKYLTQLPPITQEQQLKWFERERMSHESYTFSIVEEKTGSLIGSASIYSINQDSAEFGRVLIGDLNQRGKGLGADVTQMCLIFGFQVLSLASVTAEVYDENVAAKNAFFNAGFSVVDKLWEETTGWQVLKLEALTQTFKATLETVKIERK